MASIIKLTLSIALLAITWNAVAQNCTQKLKEAEDEFEAGRLLGIPDLLDDCLLGNNFSKEETIRAYKLKSLVYIFSDQEKEAEESLIDLLKADPEHQLDPEIDPAEIFYLYEKFRTEPIFRIGLKVGINRCGPSPFGEFRVFDEQQLTRNYKSKAGFDVEASIERHLWKGIEVSAGVQFRSSSFSVEDSIKDTNIVVKINDAQTWIRTPLLVRYNLDYEAKKPFTPYAMMGISLDYLLIAKYVDSERQGGNPKSVNPHDLLKDKERNKLNLSLFSGAGLKYRIGTHYLTVEARLDFGLFNYTNAENRFASNEGTFGLAYVPDNVRLNFISGSIGYARSIYNPKKKK